MSNQSNITFVSAGLTRLLSALAPYVVSRLVEEYAGSWWQRGVRDQFHDDQLRDLPVSGTRQELTASLDILKCLQIIDAQWRDVFRKKLPQDCKGYVSELKGSRNKWAHAGMAGINDADTWRMLDTMGRLAEHIDGDTAAAIFEIQRKARYGNAKGSTAQTTNNAAAQVPKKTAPAQTKAANGLPSWREVMEPHMDVAEGRYRNAEFAADLAQVARGKGELEYRDPVEFFNRTYVTEGMKGLLVQSLRRVCGKGGEPVIQLKTAFGGGKTHSMLALYHMMRSRAKAGQVPALKAVLEAAGVSGVLAVHVAVLVGTAINPAKATRPATMPGITVNTLWGEMAYQLAESAKNPKLYDYVKDADKKGVSPGSKALADLFDACGCCLILMDEIVAYAKKLYGVAGLPAGTLDNFITFIQELTEAARASRCSLVVASIPESQNEIGGEAGQRALEQIEHTFGRMEAIWKPVGASEGFEVVRRRLFLNCKDEAARDEVCNKFSKMYSTNPAEFPVDARELDYRDRMVSCYPIHPEVFDRLYEDWATLERFQRTRGVLRLMAAVIHELWMAQDPSPMIMPGSFPLDNPNVRDELTRYLDEGWNAVVDSEVDGKQSLPYRKDAENNRYGMYLASRRVARTVMLGSAPDVKGQTVRGIEKAHVRLGTVQPGENISVFNDALGTLQSSSSYLYSDANGNRYWYDTRPTLRKVVEDRMQQIPDAEALAEVEGRLKKSKAAAPFEGVHVCPASSLDVPDTEGLRLVVLSPKVCHRGGSAESPALKLAAEMLERRGTSARSLKNTIVFAAADASYADRLMEDAKRYLAWSSIRDDRESLNLDVNQTRETEGSIKRADESLDMKIREAYSWLICPRIDLAVDAGKVEWDVEHVSGGGEGIAAKMGAKLLSNEAAVKEWAPVLLKMELDRVLWRDADHIQVKQLWTYLCSYCYLPRLANYAVLEDAIRRGLGSAEYFGVSAGFSDGRYMELTLGRGRDFINQTDLLVKPEAAQKQIQADAERAAQGGTPGGASGGASGGADSGRSGGVADSGGASGGGQGGAAGGRAGESRPPASRPKMTDFSVLAKLDNTRVTRDVRAIVEEIVDQLSMLDDAEVELRFEVRAHVAEGIPDSSVRTLSENCNTLGHRDFEFH